MGNCNKKDLLLATSPSWRNKNWKVGKLFWQPNQQDQALWMLPIPLLFLGLLGISMDLYCLGGCSMSCKNMYLHSYKKTPIDHGTFGGQQFRDFRQLDLACYIPRQSSCSRYMCCHGFRGCPFYCPFSSSWGYRWICTVLADVA